MAARFSRPSKLADELAIHYTSSDPDALRTRAIDAVLEVAEADTAAWFTVCELDGVPRLAGWQVASAGSRDLEKCFRAMAADPDPWEGTPLSFRRPARSNTLSFHEIDSLLPQAEFESSAFFQKFFAPIRVADQIRLLVYQGPRFIGWIGALRKHGAPRFDARDRKRLAMLVTPVAGALCAADAALRPSLPADRAVVVLRPDGAIDFASIPGTGWLDRPGFREALRAATVAFDQGRVGQPERKTLLEEAECRLIRVDGEAGTVRYIATLTPARQLLRAMDHALTDVQRRVAESAAAGATIAEIATDLGRGVETVRTHLREVYRRLDVSTRLELARALENLDD